MTEPYNPKQYNVFEQIKSFGYDDLDFFFSRYIHPIIFFFLRLGEGSSLKRLFWIFSFVRKEGVSLEVPYHFNIATILSNNDNESILRKDC